MEVLYPRCCGLDVHKSSITACVHSPAAHRLSQSVFEGEGRSPDGMLYAPKLSTRSKRKR